MCSSDLFFFLFLFFLIFYFILFFWLCWAFIAARGLSLVAVSGGYSVAVHRLLIAVASYCGARALGCAGFSSCGTWAQ